MISSEEEVEETIKEKPSAKELFEANKSKHPFNNLEAVREQKYIGTNALVNQMQKYYNVDKFTQLQESKTKKIKNPVMQCLIEINKNKIMPKSMGLVHKKNPFNIASN